MGENMMVATREIAWNIPTWFIIVMYVLLVISLGFFARSMYKKYLFVTDKKCFKNLLPEKFNWSAICKMLIFQGKVPRTPGVGIFHGAIYYGFIILVVATALVMAHMDAGIEVFKGRTYIIISFLADIAGVVILIGVGAAFVRRYLSKPDYLEASKPNQEMFMYLVIFLLMVTGFFVEGARIIGTDMPIGEKVWSPVGYFIAVLFQSMNLSEGFWPIFHKVFWMIHLLLTMCALATIGETKFFHILVAPINAFLTPPRQGAVLEAMNFEDENAETFGLGKVSELTMKNKLDLISCLECGRCTQNCPANKSNKKLDPKKIVTKMRDLVIKMKEDGIADKELWEEARIYEDNELEACTTCGACMEECPVHIEHVKLIMEAKRYKVLTLGEIDPDAATTINNIKINSNPWGIGGSDRFNWAKDLDVPVANPDVEVDYLFHVGCAGSFDADGQKVTKAFIKLLQKANVNFAVLGDAEKCCGDTVRRLGDEYSFYEIALENIEIFKMYKFKKIVVTCPHGLHTLGKEYKKFDDKFNYEVIHHTELLADLIKEAKLVPNHTIKEDVTYHDPCYLGRHHDGYSSARYILNSIPGVNVVEMKNSKDTSLCCGMGGGNMWYEIPDGTDPCLNRLSDIADTGKEKVSTACFFCWTNFISARGENKLTENLQVEDVTLTLSKSIF